MGVLLAVLVAVGAALFLIAAGFTVLRLALWVVLLPFRLLLAVLVLPLMLLGAVIKFIVLLIVVPVVGAVLFGLAVAAAAVFAVPVILLGFFVFAIWAMAKLVSAPVALVR